MDTEPKLIPIRAMANRLRVPIAWLRQEALEGRIPCVRAGRRALLVDPETVERVLLERARTGGEDAR